MYVAVKGGERAIDHAHDLMNARRRGDKNIAPLSIHQIKEQMSFAVARVMSEGSLYDADLAALAIKQSAGDLIEAIFLLRAYRTTLSRFYTTQPLETEKKRLTRRISATYKDLPGGQLLGPTFDYTHRLLDFSLAAEQDQVELTESNRLSDHHTETDEVIFSNPRVSALLAQEGLLKTEQNSDTPLDVSDITRNPLDFPASRAAILQTLARGDEGFLLSLSYSTQRGYGRNHPFAGEIRIGLVEVWIEPEELGFAISIGEIEITECEMINQFIGSKDIAAQFTSGYGLSFGHNERKAMSMALVDRSLRASEYAEDIISPAQQQEFVLSHCDNVEAAGFVSHLKLPHYVDFQSELDLLRRLHQDHKERT